MVGVYARWYVHLVPEYIDQRDSETEGEEQKGGSLLVDGPALTIPLAVVLGGTLIAVVIAFNGIIGARLHTPFAITSRAAFGYNLSNFAVISRMVRYLISQPPSESTDGPCTGDCMVLDVGKYVPRRNGNQAHDHCDLAVVQEPAQHAAGGSERHELRVPLLLPLLVVRTASLLTSVRC